MKAVIYSLERRQYMEFSFMYKEGGAHPDEQKGFTDSKPIIDASVPKLMAYPIAMHIGAPAAPIVEVGD